MSAESQLYTLLTGTAAVTALVSTRIYPDEAPPGVTMPFVVYQRISTDADASHDLASISAARLDGCRFQVTVIAATQAACIAVLHQIRLAIERATSVRGLLVDERSVPRDEAAQAHGRQADFLIWADPE